MRRYEQAKEYAAQKWNDEAYSTAEEKGFVFTIGEQKKMTESDFLAGYNAAMEEWRKCYLQCSSPYCAGYFRDIKNAGTLGNMTKREVKENVIHENL
jgi:hypothetical protein